MATESQRRVEPYPDPPMERQRLLMETYEYRMPFNYPNVTVNRRYLKGMEFHGVEMNPINSIGWTRSTCLRTTSRSKRTIRSFEWS